MSINNDGKTINRKIKHSNEINVELERINQSNNEDINNSINKDNHISPNDTNEKFKRR